MGYVLTSLKIGIICFSVFAFIFHPLLINRLTQWYIKLKSYVYNNNCSHELSLNYEVNFHLWTRFNREPESLVVGSEVVLTQTHYVSRKTYLIIHGFSNHGLAPWIISMKNALLQQEDCNVISVDWQSGSISGEYFIIQGRVPEVGEDLAHLIDFLHNTADLRLEDVNIIGHSLGAHVAGFASKPFNGKIGRISAIDPASYGFRNVAPHLRLDRSDARLVDVIHTNACVKVSSTFLDCYGLDENIGHVDFWPNGGEHQAPCDDGGSGIELTESISFCDHSIGKFYYLESISSSILSPKFLARQCESWDHYKNGSCLPTMNQQLMGHHASQKYPGTYYLDTRKNSPFSMIDLLCLFIHAFKQIVVSTLMLLILVTMKSLALPCWKTRLQSLLLLLKQSLDELFSVTPECVQQETETLKFTQY